MNRLRTLIIGGLIAAFTITIVGTFVLGASHKTKLAIVNGVPGKRVDVCINGHETKSALPYGAKVFREVGNAPKLVKFFAADPRQCKGVLLGRKSFDPPPGGTNLTIVLSKRKPNRVALFDNTQYYPDLDPGDSLLIWRYAGDIGKTNLYIDIIQSQPLPPGPAATPSASPWAKTNAFGADVPAEEFAELRSRATRNGKTKTIAKTPFGKVKAGQRHETILVGTDGSNARFVRVNRKAPVPTPSPTP